MWHSETTEQIGTNRGIPENKERKSEQIGRNGEIATIKLKSEQIGVTPFCRPKSGPNLGAPTSGPGETDAEGQKLPHDNLCLSSSTLNTTGRRFQPYNRRDPTSPLESGTGEKGVITKGVFSLEESLNSLNSLESLENGRILLYFPQSGGSLKSLESLENGLF